MNRSSVRFRQVAPTESPVRTERGFRRVCRITPTRWRRSAGCRGWRWSTSSGGAGPRGPPVASGRAHNRGRRVRHRPRAHGGVRAALSHARRGWWHGVPRLGYDPRVPSLPPWGDARGEGDTHPRAGPDRGRGIVALRRAERHPQSLGAGRLVLGRRAASDQSWIHASTCGRSCGISRAAKSSSCGTTPPVRRTMRARMTAWA